MFAGTAAACEKEKFGGGKGEVEEMKYELRHFGNFGFLVDHKTNKVIAPAPLFDHGNSLFNYAGEDDFITDDTLSAYAETLLPYVYDDFIGTAKKGTCTPTQGEPETSFKFSV